MRRLSAMIGVVLTLLVAAPDGVHAQDPPRSGFFAGVGAGYGSFGCSTCGGRNSSPAGYVKLGVNLGARVRQGLEVSAWTKSEAGNRITHGNLSVVVHLYPLVESGLFLKVGAGFSRLVVKDAATDQTESDAGLGLTGGLGYDVPIGGGFSVTPYGSYQWGDFDGGRADHYQLGVGLTWH